jgi:hypothetical protein
MVFSFPSVTPSSLMCVCQCIGAGGNFPSLHSLWPNICVLMHQLRKVLSILPSLPLAPPMHRMPEGAFPHFCRSLLSDASPQMHQGMFHPSLTRSHSLLSDGVTPISPHSLQFNTSVPMHQSRKLYLAFLAPSLSGVLQWLPRNLVDCKSGVVHGKWATIYTK